MPQTRNTRQYTLPIIQKPDFTSYSYFVSSSNQEAYRLVELWPNWPFKGYVIYGPPGHGKTHLGHILRDLTDGIILESEEINTKILRSISPAAVYIVDNLDRITRPEILFHFYNLTMEKNCCAVYLSKVAPGQVDFGLADLNSRLRSLPAIELLQCDDALCEAVIKKVFADLNLSVAQEVIDYILAHTERSLTEIQINLQKLNQSSLEFKRNITIPFVRSILNVN